MLVGFRDGAYPSGFAVAATAGLDTDSPYDWDVILTILRRWNLSTLRTTGLTATRLARLLKRRGPAWLVERRLANHAVVLVGVQGNGMPEYTMVTLLNPAPDGAGSVEYKTFSELDREFHLQKGFGTSLVVAQRPTSQKAATPTTQRVEAD